MPEKFKKRILNTISGRDYKPVKLHQLAVALGIGKNDYEAFKQAFEDLRQQGRLVIGSGSAVTLPAISGRIIGTYRANPRGFGFVVPLEANAHGDLFIPPGSENGAMTGDTVSARVQRRGRQDGRQRYSGEIIEILDRAKNRFVGTVAKQSGRWFVIPDGKGFSEPIYIGDASAKNAGINDKALVEILTYPAAGSPATGVILEVFGKSGVYDAEIQSIIKQHNLPAEFSDVVLNQASQTAKDFDPAMSAGRRDITNKTVITIDPDDAKDFDDAISLEYDEKGNYILGVHIADVSCFVPMDSPLDIEAKNRGNSVYLPGKVLPMLPEVLSNGICSLQPQQSRFVKSVYITYDRGGNVLGRSYANSLIKSTARLTYLQADRIINGQTEGIAREIVKLLKDMEKLAKIIEQRRNKAGMLHLDLPETELIFDDEGQVVDARPADTSYPHTIIEMFMVEANEAVASLMDKMKAPFIRRIHPEPDQFAMKQLSQIVNAAGISAPKIPDRYAIQSLLANVRGSPSEYAINIYVLKSLQRAEYSPLDIEHYALASRHYSHFTSPIRRYADLMLHRLLDCYLRGKLGRTDSKEIIDQQQLLEIGKHITFTEQRAEEAEEELKLVLILQMLSKHIGERLDTVVSGPANFGVFMRCKKFGVEGLIRLEDLGPDQWKFDEKTQSIIGRCSGLQIRLGDEIPTIISAVSLPARRLSLGPAEPLGKQKTVRAVKAHKPKKTKNRRKRGR